MTYNDDPLFKRLQGIFVEHGSFDETQMIEIRFRSIVKKIQMQFKRMNNARIHVSYTPFTINANIVKQPVFSEKPEGIWYGMGDSWIKDVVSKVPEWITSYAYEIKVDPNKIKNVSKFAKDLFNEEFGDEDYPHKYKWDKMSKGFCGVETKDYSVVKELLPTWATLSGCIWNPACIIGFHEIKLDITDEDREFIKVHGNKRQ